MNYSLRPHAFIINELSNTLSNVIIIVDMEVCVPYIKYPSLNKLFESQFDHV